MILKIKAKIYQLTGIFLAQKEQDEYKNTPAFKIEADNILNYPEQDMNLEEIEGILIDSWQAEHGFHRRFVTRYPFGIKHKWRGRKWLESIVIWCYDFWINLKG